MKASVRVRSSKRAAVAAVAGLAALTALSGCGFETRQQAAAVVNGKVIHESDVAETSRQLSKLNEGKNVPETDVLRWLLAGTLIDETYAQSGGWKSSPEYAKFIAAVPGASDSTQTFLRAYVQVQSGELVEQTPVGKQFAQVVERAKVSVNPKYGVFKRTDKSPTHFDLGAASPNWIAPDTKQPAAETAP